jgi:hypothetical protein
MLREGFVALLATAIVPAAFPLALGVNVAVKLTLCPACNVAGRLRPVMANTEPLAVACEIVTAAEPPFVRVMVCA